MAKVGMKASAPVINIAPAPTDAKRKGEFFVNDIQNTIALLNVQIAKAGKVGIAVDLSVGSENGITKVQFDGATRQ